MPDGTNHAETEGRQNFQALEPVAATRGAGLQLISGLEVARRRGTSLRVVGGFLSKTQAISKHCCDVTAMDSALGNRYRLMTRRSLHWKHENAVPASFGV